MSSSFQSLFDAEESIEPIVSSDREAPTETGVSFARGQSRRSVEVVDLVDRHRYTLQTDTDVSPVPTAIEEFLFPVDAGIEVTASTISLPTVVPVCVRDPDGNPIVKTDHFANEELPADEYSIELCAPVRVYLRVKSSLQIVSGTDHIRLTFDDETAVQIGARSRREQPAATITTTDDPEDLMAAISTFGSALTTTSPERSFPSFRGHPPLIERGDELDIPDVVTPLETGLRIEVPPTHRAIYVIAPLAYYLGATVVPGEVPRLVADTGFEHRLDSLPVTEEGKTTDPQSEFENCVAQTLKQVFLLDCVVRTEGIYPIELHERHALADALEFNLTELYNQPLAERVAAYLDIPYATVEPHLPEWKLTTHIEPSPENAESLAYAVNDLPVVRTPASGTLSVSEERAAIIDQQNDAVDDFLRSASRGEVTDTATGDYIEPQTTDSLESVWIGEGRPLNGGKATADAYRNRLDRKPTEGNIDVTVVCNDIDQTRDQRESMQDEHAAIDEAYGSQLSLPFEVSVHHDLTTDELRNVLTADTDFLHYIGHIDERGVECPDGVFDIGSLDAVGADAFFLNACQSYDQGMAMLDAGAISGIVTLVDVVNDGALALGKAIPRLLNAGFPMGTALEVARSEAVAGQRYLVVGDSGLSITQAEGVVPNLYVVERSGNSFEVDVKTYPTSQDGMGSVVIPYLEQNDEYFLCSGSTDTFELSQEELQEFLLLENAPVKAGGKLRWSQYLDVTAI